MSISKHSFPTYEDFLKNVVSSSTDTQLRRRMAVENGFFGWVRTR